MKQKKLLPNQYTDTKISRCMKTYQTVKAALINGERNILLIRRSQTHPTQGLHEDLPGGVVDDNEQPAKALVREIKEETGIRLSEKELKLFFVCTEEIEGKNAIRLVYAASIPHKKPEIKLSGEHDQYQWLSLDQAIQALPDWRYTRWSLEYMKNKKILNDL